MVVVMKERATEVQIDAVIARLIELGMDVHRSSGATRTVLGVVGEKKIDPALIALLDGVHEVVRISEPYKRASRTFRPQDTIVTVGGLSIYDYTRLSARDALEWIASVELTETERAIARLVVREVEERLTFLVSVGIGWASF